MTGFTSVTQATDVRTPLLGEGVESIAATPPLTAPPSSRLDAGWEEFAAAYLQEHPEISAMVPSWTDEIDFSTIEDEVEGTIFSFSKSIGEVELYGSGIILPDGRVHVPDGGTPSVYLPAEIASEKVADIAQELLDLARDLISAASLLRSEPKLLRRPAEVDAELMRLDI